MVLILDQVVKENNDKEPEIDVDESIKKASIDELYTLPSLNDETSRGFEDIKFGLRTMDDPQLCARLLFKVVYWFKEALKKFIFKDGRDIVLIKNEKIRVTIEYKNRYG